MAVAGERLYVAIDIDSAKAGRALKRIDKNMAKTQKSAMSLQRSFSRLNGAIGILLGANMIGGLVKSSVQLVDTYNELSGRIGLVVNDSEKLVSVQEDLYQVANQTYTAYDAVGSLYARLGMATKELGATHEQLVGATQTVANTLRLSGASAQEARSSMLQLSQSMASGVLAGDEFKSISENNVALMDLLADALDVTRGELKKMSADGLLTTNKVFGALIENTEKYQKLVEGLPLTVGRAMTKLENVWQNLLVESSKADSSMQGLAESINQFADALNEPSTRAGLAALFSGLIDIGRGVGYVISQFGLWGQMLGEGAGRMWLVSTIQNANVEIEELESRMQTHYRGISALSDEAKKKADAHLDVMIKRRKELVMHRDAMKDVYFSGSSDSAPPVAPPSRTNPDPLTSGGVNPPSPGKDADKDKYNKNLDEMYAATEDYYQGLADLERKRQSEALAREEALQKDMAEVIRSQNPYADQVDEINRLYELMDRFPEHGDVIANELQRIGTEMNSLNETSEDTWLDMKQGMTDIAVQGIGSMSDALVDFALTGEQSFGEMTKSILADMAKMILRMQMMAALKAIFGGFGGSNYSEFDMDSLAYANGGVFQGGVQKFARGGIVNSPTIFPMANGMGLMGEAGPEAVMPLTRGANGKLGVQGGGGVTNVNIINNSGGEATVTEQENSSGGMDIQVMIEKSVDSYMASGGANGLMGSQFGARPRPR